MKILQLTGHLNAGGITTYLYTLSSGFIQRGHKVIICAEDGSARKRFNLIGVTCVDMKLRYKSQLHPGLYLQLPALCRLVKEQGIDVIHAHTRSTQLVGTLLSWLTRKPLVTTCHGFFKAHWFRKTFGCWGRHVIAISPSVAKHLQEDLNVALEKVVEINNGIDMLQFPPVIQAQQHLLRAQRGWQESKVIGIIARLSSVKGIDVLIDAFALVRKSHPHAKLLIVGNGPEFAALKKQADRYGFAQSIVFENEVAQTAHLLPLCDVYVSPSRMEGLGLSVMEAMASALPVVVSRVGGLVNLIEDGKDGFLVEPDNPEQLAAVINKVLDNPAQAKLIGQHARQKIEAYYNAQHMVEATLKVYEKNISH